jgi:hypothetical protein
LPLDGIESEWYSSKVERIRTNPIFRFGFGDSATYSRILPTRRWYRTVLCIFSSPRKIVRGQNNLPKPPDRWAAFDLDSGRLQVFAFAWVVPFTDRQLQPLEDQSAADPHRGPAQRTHAIAALLSQLVPEFARDEGRDGVGSGARRELLELLHTTPHPGFDKWEEAMVPDFFEWLREG